MAWLPKKSVVVPIDFSDESFGAALTALELVADATHLHAIHVLPHLSPFDLAVIRGEIDNDSRIRHSKDALAEGFTDAQFRGIHLEIAIGDSAKEIAAFAQRIAADLIVLPSHGKTGAAHFLLGSVAEGVIRYAHCPVLVLRD